MPQNLADAYGLDSESVVDQEVAKAVAAGEGQEMQRTPRQLQLQRLANRAATVNRPGNEDINENDMILGDGGQTILLKPDGFETHAPDANDPGLKMGGDSSEFRTGGAPLERDTTADKDIFADGKTWNRKGAYSGTNIVDPYKPMLNSAPMWARGLVRGIVIALRLLDESMGED